MYQVLVLRLQFPTTWTVPTIASWIYEKLVCYQFYSPDIPSFCRMMTSAIRSIFRVSGNLCGEITGPWWISPHKVSLVILLTKIQYM